MTKCSSDTTTGFKILLGLISIVVLLLLLTSCARRDVTIVSFGIKSRYWHNAYYQAVVIESELGLPTRIVIGRNQPTEEGHAQAQAYVDNRWQWISWQWVSQFDRPIVFIDNRKDQAWGKIHKSKQYYTKEQVINLWGR